MVGESVESKTAGDNVAGGTEGEPVEGFLVGNFVGGTEGIAEGR